MNTSTLTCIGFVQSLSKNYTDAVDTFHKALGQKREDTFSSTMLNCVLEMCIEDPPRLNDYLDEDEITESKKALKMDRVLKMNDDNDVVFPFRNPRFRLWNRRLKQCTEDASHPMDDGDDDDSNAMVVENNITIDNSAYSMDMSTNMSDNSDGFK